MKILFVSNLFPDSVDSLRGQGNATVVHHLAGSNELRVISPRPVRPLTPWRAPAGRAVDRAFEPLFVPAPYVPRFGSRWNHRLMARALREPVARVRVEFTFDVVLCAWLFPDACAVELLAAELGAPIVAIAQGTDVHDYLSLPPRRRAIVGALTRIAATITRSADLARRLAAAGVPPTSLRPVYNGVDRSVFRLGGAREARRELGLPASSRIVLYVGRFSSVKDPLLLIAAHAELLRRVDAPCELVMIGSGPLERQARRVARKLGSAAHTRFVGRQPPEQVARFMQAADVLCVPSRAEGLPNVVLEALACGLRCVATRVGGIPEVLEHDFLGRLVPPANAPALAEALCATLDEPAQPEAIHDYARRFSWERTVEAYRSVLAEACRS